MRQENSVLFALRDLRSLESDRVAEQERIEAEQQRAEAERQRAEAERRLAEDERRRADEAQKQAQAQKEREERDAPTRALEQAAGRNEQLQSDVQTLRALVSAVRPEPVERRLWPFALVAAAGVALAIVLVASQRPIVRERIVYVPATAAAVPAPALPTTSVSVAAPPVRVEPPAIAPHARPRPKKRVIPPAPIKLPLIEDCGGKDPLCGVHL